MVYVLEFTLILELSILINSFLEGLELEAVLPYK